MFVPYSADCEYRLEFRAESKDKPLGIATIYDPNQIEN